MRDDDANRKKRVKVDLDPVASKILDFIAEQIETDLIPRPERTPLLLKAVDHFAALWLEAHPDHREEIEQIRARYGGRKPGLRLANGQQNKAAR